MLPHYNSLFAVLSGTPSPWSIQGPGQRSAPWASALCPSLSLDTPFHHAKLHFETLLGQVRAGEPEPRSSFSSDAPLHSLPPAPGTPHLQSLPPHPMVSPQLTALKYVSLMGIDSYCKSLNSYVWVLSFLMCQWAIDLILWCSGRF